MLLLITFADAGPKPLKRCHDFAKEEKDGFLFSLSTRPSGISAGGPAIAGTYSSGWSAGRRGQIRQLFRYCTARNLVLGDDGRIMLHIEHAHSILEAPLGSWWRAL